MRDSAEADEIIKATRRWLEKVVIGLNLCPFAVTPWRQGRIHFRLSAATDTQQLAEDLIEELMALQASDPAERETTLLIHPDVLGDFLDYNDFLDVADRILAELGLEGTLQIASFHPDYQFADSAPDDTANCSSRSPYPTLHLLREASVAAAVEHLADPDLIYERNIQTLRRLGTQAWQALMDG
ncbi:MAG: DUF1415 domain-containing protein [Wenzhouxiangella sp.]|nr:DUF1415 domain-containing protein [Wenzhouxiangella sp.]MCH8476472.1 DUF1415 domain-containing protein [Wenzhouxiangella sp.]